MPKPLKYRSGSLIYFHGDPAERIFILQDGKVSLGYQDIESGTEIRDSVQPGEFFGVKSALGRYPREETAMALSDTTVMVFSVPEFEAVAMANSRIIMKMLKVFSNQMRRVHKQVSKLVAKKEDEPPADSLYNVGEFYLKNKRFSHAKYVFSRYLTFHPSGRYAIQASKNLEIAENAISRHGSGTSQRMAAGGFETQKPQVNVLPQDSAKTEKAYNEAVSLVSQGKYQEAFLSFKLIADSGADPTWTAKSSYQVGRCMFLMKKYEDCIKYFSNLFNSYPKHPDFAEIMFIMGQCNEKSGRKEQAAAFYKKILSMGTGSEGTLEKVKQALDLLTSGVQGA